MTKRARMGQKFLGQKTTRGGQLARKGTWVEVQNDCCRWRRLVVSISNCCLRNAVAN